MQVLDVSDHGKELSISGKLVDGSFMGPEALLLCDEAGAWAHSTVVRHSITLPKDWPIVPNDGSTLILRVWKPNAGFKLDQRQMVVGQGAIAQNPNRIDISTSLAEPEFWAIWMPLHLVESDDLPEASLAWGLTRDEKKSAYARIFKSNWSSGLWPYVRFGLPQRRYIEIEYAAGIEYQNRVWIGAEGGPRVLLGYDSGHFSFPSLRIRELVDLAMNIDGHPAAPLLLLEGAYLLEGEPFPAEQVERCLRQSPGFQETYLDLIVSGLGEHAVPGLSWTLTEDRGWINNWKYSQRNPASTMSILRLEDFGFIREFFSF
jgi:hypothetical protein